MKNIRIFYLKICHFLVVKFSIYLNRRVFVMNEQNGLYMDLLLIKYAECPDRTVYMHFVCSFCCCILRTNSPIKHITAFGAQVMYAGVGIIRIYPHTENKHKHNCY